MTSRQQIEDAIDAAREDRTFTPLRAIILAFALSYTSLSEPDLEDVVGDCARKIVELIKKGTITPTIANQLYKIVINTVNSLKRKQAAANARIADVDPEDAEASEAPSDPLTLLEDSEALQELINDLRAVREENERYFVALTALIDGESVSARLERHFGITLAKDTVYKVTERARKKLVSMMSKRKEGIS